MRKATLFLVAVVVMLVLAPAVEAITPDTNFVRIMESYVLAQVEYGALVENPGQNPEGGWLLDSLAWGQNAQLADTFTLDQPMWNVLIFCTAAHVGFGVSIRTENGGAYHQMVLGDGGWWWIPGKVSSLVLTKLHGDTATATVYGVLGYVAKPASTMKLRP